MGLDITASTRLKLVSPDQVQFDEDGYSSDEHLKFHAIRFTEENWPGRTHGLVEGAYYEPEDSFGFRAGSYSGYNAWRDWLARVAGSASAEAVWSDPEITGPFAELIHFSDCEGVIGPIVSAKLTKDFADFEEKAMHENGWFFEAYIQWETAVQFAADNGAIEFH